MNDLINKAFENTKQELLKQLGNNYKIVLDKLFNLSTLEENIYIKVKMHTTELFSINIKKKDLLDLPDLIRNNTHIIKNKLIKETVDRKVMYGDGGESTVIHVIVGNFIVDEFNNPVVDEFNNNIVWS